MVRIVESRRQPRLCPDQSIAIARRAATMQSTVGRPSPHAPSERPALSATYSASGLRSRGSSMYPASIAIVNAPHVDHSKICHVTIMTIASRRREAHKERRYLRAPVQRRRKPPGIGVGQESTDTPSSPRSMRPALDPASAQRDSSSTLIGEHRPQPASCARGKRQIPLRAGSQVGRTPAPPWLSTSPAAAVRKIAEPETTSPARRSTKAECRGNGNGASRHLRACRQRPPESMNSAVDKDAARIRQVALKI